MIYSVSFIYGIFGNSGDDFIKKNTNLSGFLNLQITMYSVLL